MKIADRLRWWALLGLVAAGPVRAETLGVDLRLKTQATWAENISRSSSALDWADAMTYSVTASAEHQRQLTVGVVGLMQIEASALHRPEFRMNDEANLALNGELRRKFGLGPMAPVLALNAGLTGKSARISENDGWTAAAGVTLSKRITESWRAAVTGDWHEHYASSAIYDTRYRQLFGEISWDITDRWQLTYGLGRFWGDFTANASPLIWPRALSGQLGAAIAAYYNKMPWGVTDSYGPGWVTYRVYGTSQLWWLQLAPALTDQTSLSLRYDSIFTVNKVNVKYRTDMWTLGLLHSF